MHVNTSPPQADSADIAALRARIAVMREQFSVTAVLSGAAVAYADAAGLQRVLQASRTPRPGNLRLVSARR